MTESQNHRYEIGLIIMQVLNYIKNGQGKDIPSEGYLKHFISERFTYVVALQPKGRLEISIEAAQDFGSMGITEEAINRIANTYRVT